MYEHTNRDYARTRRSDEAWHHVPIAFSRVWTIVAVRKINLLRRDVLFPEISTEIFTRKLTRNRYFRAATEYPDGLRNAFPARNGVKII